MNLSTADSLLLQRYLDGELDTAALAAWRVRVEREPALQQALAAQHPGVDFYQVQPAAANSLLPERRFQLLRINA